uniref:Sulfotransferase domain-containing protein n=1 Tax=Pyramimonas obovata TaxID=1411642 RepID=A0A7S0QUJ8_9CHLO
MATNPWCRLLVLVCALQTVPRDTLALGKVSPHCSKGLCLYLIPGDRVGLVKARESLANPVVPGADQGKDAVPPNAGRKLLQIPVQPTLDQTQHAFQMIQQGALNAHEEQMQEMKKQFLTMGQQNPQFTNPNAASMMQMGQTQMAADPAAQAQMLAKMAVNMAGNPSNNPTQLSGPEAVRLVIDNVVKGITPDNLPHNDIALADPHAIVPKNREFLRVYFPTLPRSGQLHLRKLWEACTKRVTESANVGVGLQLNSRTGAFTPLCGGVALNAENETMLPATDDIEKCSEIRMGKNKDPVLIKSNEPSEYAGPVFRETADVVLMLVRNPVDAYQSMFRSKNPKYVLTKDVKDLEWKLTFDQYLATVWEAYVTHFDNVPVPRIVVRYEDLYRDPQDFMKEVLMYTGAASAHNLDDQAIVTAVKQVQEATKAQVPKDVVGEGFEVLMSLSPSDQQFAMSVLSKYSATLKSLGYVYYKAADGVPADLAAMKAAQERAERSRLDALKDAGFSIAEALRLDPELLNMAKTHGHVGAMVVMGVAVIVAALGVVDRMKARAAGTSSTLDKAVAFASTVADAASKKGEGGGFALLSAVRSTVASASESAAMEIDSLKKRLKDKMTAPKAAAAATASTPAAMESQSIVDQAQSVMRTNVETPAAKLARLKMLRDKLAQVKD